MDERIIKTISNQEKVSLEEKFQEYEGETAVSELEWGNDVGEEIITASSKD